MPWSVDQKKIDDSSLKMMDIGNPPMIQIPMAEFPRMVYLYPKDKTKEGLHKVVDTAAELGAAIKEGWHLKPHIPEAPPAAEMDDYEYETLEPFKPAKR